MLCQPHRFKGLLFAAVSPVLFVASTHAAVATFVRTLTPDIDFNAQKLAPTVAGGMVVLGSYGFHVVSPSMGTLLQIMNWSPGATGEPFRVADGALQLLDGRLVAVDGPQNRLVVFSTNGTVLAHWPTPAGRGSQPQLAPNGDFFVANSASGTTTISHWTPGGVMLGSWSTGTAASHIALRNGVIYLAGDPLGRIFKFALDGTPLDVVVVYAGPLVRSIEVDDAGRIYLAFQSYQDGRYHLWIRSPDGTLLEEVPLPGLADGLMVRDARLYVADRQFVQEFSIDSPVPTRTTSWGRLKSLYH